MKTGISLILLLLLSVLHSEAQTDTVFFDKDWKRVSTSESAAYVRPPAVKLASGKYQVVDYFANTAQPLLVAEYLDKDLKTKDGYFISYHENGQMESEGYNKNGKREGHWIGYYKSGVKEYEGEMRDDKWNGDFVSYHDNGKKQSEGTRLNGAYNGFWKWYAEDGKTLTFYANYKNGIYHGDVVRYHKNGAIARQDHYKNGKLKSVRCYTEAGSDAAWCADRKYPTFPGGDGQYTIFVENDSRYKEFRENNPKVKGTVYIEAFFDETGKMYKSDVVQSLQPEADTLALEIMRSMPDWIPALDESNRPVKSTRRLDIKF
ncbi:toxin-antitoxin system YwqK family antitoxin [Polluticoccus soli]|uniref:toxin-antitoxin system YwqK family antitoxin n=1 Tax=Polluticoccus soli TaxID=3034150 RepID=UPI0023E2A0B8|nr:toxin-antitoxin system YwqK family antitoxin [Flavipsychrobacter sp. JY13-12]